MAKTTITRRGGAIRLTVPVKVANDLGSLQAALKGLADRLGHPMCFTGCDIFHVGEEREFVINEASGFSAQISTRSARFDRSRGTVTVTVPDKVNDNIDLLNRAVGSVLGKLGCDACCSGFDILFQREINTMAMDERGGVARFGGVA
jgi:hypothetical protein